jgi:hypothetical protein
MGWPWVFLHKGCEAIEAFGPEALIAAEPIHGLPHRRRRQPARHHTPGLFPRDETGIREHIEMLHDRRQRHRERLRQLADRQAVAAGQPRQQRTAGRVRERGEGLVEGLIEILNHLVLYKTK